MHQLQLLVLELRGGHEKGLRVFVLELHDLQVLSDPQGSEDEHGVIPALLAVLRFRAVHRADDGAIVHRDLHVGSAARLCAFAAARPDWCDAKSSLSSFIADSAASMAVCSSRIVPSASAIHLGSVEAPAEQSITHLCIR